MSDPVKGDYDSFEAFCKREDPEYDKGRNGKFMCPCCQHFTLDECASYDICPVCFWEDDGTTGEHGFSPNGVSLIEARQNYQKFGANTERDLKHVRPPRTEEIS
jgi:hypothetical protein